MAVTLQSVASTAVSWVECLVSHGVSLVTTVFSLCTCSLEPVLVGRRVVLHALYEGEKSEMLG